MEKMFIVGEAARRRGVHLTTIQRWDRDEKLRVIRTAGGKRPSSPSEIDRLLGSIEPSDERWVLAVYGRVSSHERKARGDLSRQVAHVRETVVFRGWQDIVEITDVASGLSAKRQRLIRLMEMARQGRITGIFALRQGIVAIYWHD
jgi:predicted site-specific integrase-resolvase